FEGTVSGTTEVVPEAHTLLAWARELGIPIRTEEPAAADTSLPTPNAPATSRPVTSDGCLRTLAIKGLAPAQAFAPAGLTTPDDVQSVLDGLVTNGLADTVAGAYRLTDAGKERAG